MRVIYYLFTPLSVLFSLSLPPSLSSLFTNYQATFVWLRFVMPLPWVNWVILSVAASKLPCYMAAYVHLLTLICDVVIFKEPKDFVIFLLAPSIFSVSGLKFVKWHREFCYVLEWSSCLLQVLDQRWTTPIWQLCNIWLITPGRMLASAAFTASTVLQVLLCLSGRISDALSSAY